METFRMPETLVVFSSVGRNDFTGVDAYEVDDHGNLRVWGTAPIEDEDGGRTREQDYSALFPAGKWDLLRSPI